MTSTRTAMELPNAKLFTLDAAVMARRRWGAAGRRVVLTNGVFDLLHSGHLHSLQAARELGGALLVALNSDTSVRALKGPARPILGERARAYALAALACVDGILIFDTLRLDAEIRALAPDVYVKSGDYTLEKIDAGERAALVAVGAEVRFLPFLAGFSTTSIIERIRATGTL